MLLAWQAEEVALNLRLSPVETYQDGWLIRASGGTVRRMNAVCATPFRSADFVPVLQTAEKLYARLNRPAIVKILSIGDPIDEMLQDRGYVSEGESHVLFADQLAGQSDDGQVEIHVGSTREEWIAAWAGMGASSSAVAFLRASLAAIISPTAYAVYRRDREIVSLAYGMIHRGILGIDAVVTKAEERGRGFAGHVVSGLQQWARRNGASSACLAVLADNAAAHALYRRTGFSRHLYSYHYRVKG